MPTVQSTGGVINSVAITGDNEVGEGPIDINVTLIGVGGASSSSVSWNASLYDLEGNLIDYDAGNELVNDGIEVYVEAQLGIAPLGSSNLTITLSGDVGTPSSSQWIVYEKTITKLRPLNISLGTPLFNGVDENGTYTNNLTINDGDFAIFEIPVINNGDVDWNGTLNITMDGQHLNTSNVSLAGDTTEIIYFQSDQISEGTYEIELELIGDLDSYTLDNTLVTTLQVGPPPLPDLSFDLQRITEPSSGSIMEWSLSITNIGYANFSGNIECDFDESQIINQSISLIENQTSSIGISMTSKPGILNCTSTGNRTMNSNHAEDVLTFQSALFVGAGHNFPSLLNGPWHVGDSVDASLLIRNQGDQSGNASLDFEMNNENIQGNAVSLDVGMAGELTQSLVFESSGTQYVNWSVSSIDSAVDQNLSGNIGIPIQPAQDLTILIDNVNFDQTGHTIDWSIEVTEGKNRTVFLEFGEIADGNKNSLIIEQRNVLPGKSYGSMNLGIVDSNQVYLKASVQDWTIGLGSTLEDQFLLEEYTIIPAIVANPITQPRVPAVDDKVTILYTLSNSGNGVVPDSEIIVTDNFGSILGTKSVESFSQSGQDQSIVVDWPEGENVVVDVTWHVNGVSYTDQILVKSELIEDETSGFELPLGGILGGLVLGMIGIFAIRVYNSPKEKKVKKQVEKAKPKEVGKIEVSCPTCDRRLNVPADYSGSVRCPECETKFAVEAPETDSSEEEKSEDIPEKDSEELWSSSDNDILGCPKCTRKLKVPYDRRPAKARCPACETIFEARKD